MWVLVLAGLVFIGLAGAAGKSSKTSTASVVDSSATSTTADVRSLLPETTEVPTTEVSTTEIPTTTEAPTTTIAAPTTTAAPSRWVPVGNLAGSATKQGALFALLGGQQRLSYSCQGSGGGGCIFSILQGPDEAFHVSPEHTAADTTMVYLDPGSYHLAAEIIGSWTFTMRLEELR
jgi:hypothetical protein